MVGGTRCARAPSASRASSQSVVSAVGGGTETDAGRPGDPGATARARRPWTRQTTVRELDERVRRRGRRGTDDRGRSRRGRPRSRARSRLRRAPTNSPRVPIRTSPCANGSMSNSASSSAATVAMSNESSPRPVSSERHASRRSDRAADPCPPARAGSQPVLRRDCSTVGLLASLCVVGPTKLAPGGTADVRGGPHRRFGRRFRAGARRASP